MHHSLLDRYGGLLDSNKDESLIIGSSIEHPSKTKDQDHINTNKFALNINKQIKKKYPVKLEAISVPKHIINENENIKSRFSLIHNDIL